MKRLRVRAGSSRERGNALIEFALSFALLFAVFAGVFQFGYAYHVYNSLETAVRGGARYASLLVYDSATAAPSGAYLAAVRNMVVYGNPDGTGVPVAPGLTAEKVSVVMTMNRNVPYEVTVAITGFQISAVVTAFTLNGKPRIRCPFMGRFAP